MFFMEHHNSKCKESCYMKYKSKSEDCYKEMCEYSNVTDIVIRKYNIYLHL